MRGRLGMLSRSPSPLEDDDPEEGDADLSLHIVNESQHRKLDGADDKPPGYEYKSSTNSRKWEDLYAMVDVVRQHDGPSNQRKSGKTVLQGSDISSQSTESSGGRKRGPQASRILTRVESSPEEGELHDEPQPPRSRITRDELRASRENSNSEKKKRHKPGRKKKKKSAVAKEMLIPFQEQQGQIETGVQPELLEFELPESQEPTKEKESVITSVQSATTEEVVDENAVMRKLLRGRRYFDPPDEEGDSCYNCGQVGHHESHCPEERQPKPCYVCGDLGHEGWTCPQKVQCYACGKPGHMARTCPNRRSREIEVCMRCGDYDHGTARCRRAYNADDLQHVKCYVCKNVGHLSCRSVLSEQPTELSCYSCGDLGHSGDNCRANELGRSRGGSHSRADADARSPWDSRRKSGSRSRDDYRKDDEISGSPAGRLRGIDDQVDGRRVRSLHDQAVAFASKNSPGSQADANISRLGRTQSSSRYNDDSRVPRKQRHHAHHHQLQDGKSQECEIAAHGDK